MSWRLVLCDPRNRSLKTFVLDDPAVWELCYYYGVLWVWSNSKLAGLSKQCSVVVRFSAQLANNTVICSIFRGCNVVLFARNDAPLCNSRNRTGCVWHRKAICLFCISAQPVTTVEGAGGGNRLEIFRHNEPDTHWLQSQMQCDSESQ